MAQYDVSEIAIGSDSYVLKDAQAREVKANQSDIAIIINGNSTTHTGGVAVGEYVIVRNSTISGITDGLYTAAQAIPANTAIDSTYLTACPEGGLNALNALLTNSLKQTTKTYPLTNNDSTKYYLILDSNILETLGAKKLISYYVSYYYGFSTYAADVLPTNVNIYEGMVVFLFKKGATFNQCSIKITYTYSE